jgi:hypothetical protein
VVPSIEWRVPRRTPAVKLAAAVVFLGVGLAYAGDPGRWVIAVLAAVLLGGFALRDVLAPVRLAADGTGVTVVHGFARRRHIPWADVERVRVDARARLGRRNEVLEVDTGESLYLFGPQELGADLDTVAAALVALRTGRPPSEG